MMFRKAALHVYAGMTVAALAGIDSAEANDFSDIAENITDSIAMVPGLLTGIAYMFGLLLGVLGVLKVKDHVENPGQTPLKDGAIRMASGGALFALPIVYEAMSNTIGSTSNAVSPATLSPVTFNVG
ncbi:MAG: hypothetical protein H6867_06465 [Rhodospirillales bacterium]|nr:hypothetical protein [Rhodospirillales bacterium]MCB9995192.1 hypothetical protein [Rhodospirillales bacterium]